jgi:aminopeptidase-like protein
VLKQLAPGYIEYNYLDRGSDERQYCAPGIDLPVCLITRSKFGAYPEYHTSLDNLDLVTPKGLAGGYEALRRAIETLEANYIYRATVLGEPQLGKRGLYPDLNQHGSYDSDTRVLKDTLTYCDGGHDLIAIAERIGRPAWEVARACLRLEAAGLIKK